MSANDCNRDGQPALPPATGSAVLEWQNIPPNQEGWFWRLDHGKLDIVNVKRQRAYGSQLCCLHGANFGPVEQSINALWAGPIPHPRKPQNGQAER
jgi:hypothetical protein